jgi:integrase
MAKSLSEQAEAVLKKHLAVGIPKNNVSLIGATPYKQFTSMRSFKETAQTLARIANYMGVERLKHITSEQAQTYLYERQNQDRAGKNILHDEYSDKRNASLVSQKTLDAERKALSVFLGKNIARIHSAQLSTPKPRAYTNHQVEAITKHQTKGHALATKIALNAGLRAKELITIRKADELKITTNRQWHKDRFAGVKGEKYVVVGKGGLIREIRLDSKLAEELERLRRPEPVNVEDRKVTYESHYDLPGGNNWSKSFSDASKRGLGFSNGGHGVRHQYVQSRMNTLQQLGYSDKQAKLIVSQEVGHFRASITNVYLR